MPETGRKRVRTLIGKLTCVLGDPAEVVHPLGVVRYTTRGGPPEIDRGQEKTPLVNVFVTRSDADAFTEVWTTGRPVVVDEIDDVVCGHDGEFAFAAVHVPAAPACALDVRDAYLRMFNALNWLGYPHVFRMWNFIAGINEANSDGLEIYQDFCRGRAAAFDRAPLPGGVLPAGTGVGSLGEDITIYLLAHRTSRHVAVENAVQVPAYLYPRQYGPRSPSFARAAWTPGDGRLYVSGTAGIIGHETVHRGDVVGQCRTTFANLAALTSQDNLVRHGVEAGLAAFRAVKVYVRHSADLDVVRAECDKVFSTADIAYVIADLCRADLLVEIEAICEVSR